jgi:hypothetical protein
MRKLTRIEAYIDRTTVDVSNPGDVNLHKQIFVDVFWTIWPMWKMCFGLVHAVNFHVKAVRVFVAVVPLVVQTLPLSSNKFSTFVHCDPCSSFRSSLKNNFIELSFWVLKNYSLNFGNTEFRDVRMPTYYFLQYIELLLIRHIRTQ